MAPTDVLGAASVVHPKRPLRDWRSIRGGRLRKQWTRYYHTTNSGFCLAFQVGFGHLLSTQAKPNAGDVPFLAPLLETTAW